MPAPEGWQRDAADSKLANHANEIGKTFFDVFEPGGLAPRILGGEVDDPLGPDQLRIARDEHAAHANLALLAGLPILLVGVGKRLLELERNPFAHDTDHVDGIDERLCVRLEDVADQNFDHSGTQSMKKRCLSMLTARSSATFSRFS